MMNGDQFNRGAIRPVECVKEGWELIKNDYWLLFAVALVGGLIGIMMAGQPKNPIRRLVINDIGPYIPVKGLRRIGGLVAFAGLMEPWLDADGSEIDTGAILTTRANADIAHIHDRMPLLVDREQYASWLDPAQSDPDILQGLLVPAAPGRLWRSRSCLLCRSEGRRRSCCDRRDSPDGRSR